MKILFVNAPFAKYKNQPIDEFRAGLATFREKCRKIFSKRCSKLISPALKNTRFGVRAGSRWPWTAPRSPRAIHYPFVMNYSVSLLRSKGLDADIMDCVADEIFSYKKFLKLVKQKQPDIVIVECSTPSIDIDLWMAKEISKFTDVALAGPHLVDGITEKIKNEHPHIKYLLKGEYIKSSLKITQTRKMGIYEPDVVTDLDALPFPFRDYDAATKYYDGSMHTTKPQLQIWASKGCPFKCTYCLWPHTMYKGKVALRKPEMVAQEIKQCVDKYGFKSIFFDDDTFNLGTGRIRRLCDELKKIGLPWTMMGRLDCSPDWLYDKMVDSGCVGMRFGIETFNIDVLKNVNKGLERIDFLKVLEYIANKYPQLMIHLTMMKDLPGQTEEIHQNDIKILRNLGYINKGRLRTYQLAACVPFPGTKMYENLVKQKGEKALKDFALYDGSRDTVMKAIRD